MPPISKHKLKNNVLSKLFALFFEIVGNTNREDFDLIVDDIFSSTEKVMIAKRITVMYLLLKNIDYTVICENLKISSSTVAKYRFILERSKGIKPRFNSIFTNEKILLFFEEVFLFMTGPGVAGSNWKVGWQHKRDIERRKKEGI